MFGLPFHEGAIVPGRSVFDGRRVIVAGKAAVQQSADPEALADECQAREPVSARAGRRQVVRYVAHVVGVKVREQGVVERGLWVVPKCVADVASNPFAGRTRGVGAVWGMSRSL